MRNIFVVLVLIAGLISCSGNNQKLISENGYYREQYRPQYHFSPEKMWTNDPNGLVFYKGEYHLFYQYYPDSTVWGPMHWGHAVSSDLMHWKHFPIALFPDSLGYIFSGSAVVDTANTSGLEQPGNPAMVAIFAYHNPVLEKSGKDNYQYQGLAYSGDKGRTWTKYQGNPVLPNPGLKDFRDPNVSWNNAAGKWILTLAAGDHVRFYSSDNLIDWKFESEFGKDLGAHGGVWECPSLFELKVENESGIRKWVLMVSINPGGPLGGSATQYFTGTFDGHIFKNDDKNIRWIDYGPDNYAGIPWSGTGNRTISLGWMNNWSYAGRVPTVKWRGQMTIPRDLSLVRSGNGYTLRSFPVRELDRITHSLTGKSGEKGLRMKLKGENGDLTRIDLSFPENAETVTVEYSNRSGQRIIFGFSRKKGEIFIDRTASGETGFSKDFAPSIMSVPVDIFKGENEITLLTDRCSGEFFFNKGSTVMTALVFPGKEFNSCTISAKPSSARFSRLNISTIETVWK